jgi:hypothetical protein
VRDQRIDALAHFPGGLVGEGDGQDVVRLHPLLQEPGNAAGDDPRLAAARPGQDEQRPFQMGDGFLLGEVEIVEQWH